MGGNRRQIRLVLASQLDALAEAGLEQGEGALQPLPQIDLAERCLVHVRVGLNRADQLGDPRRAVFQLGGQGDALGGGDEPAEQRRQRRLRDPGDRQLEPWHIGPHIRQGRCHVVGREGAAPLQPGDQRTFALTPLQRRWRGGLRAGGQGLK